MDHSSRRLRALALAATLALHAGAAAALEAPAPPAGVVNVNTATSEELQLLPGIGETRAKAILDARKARGGFKTVDELEDVKGIGKSALDRLRPFVSVEGKTTAKPQ